MKAAWAILCAAALSSCASVSVKNVIALSPCPHEAPQKIYVEPFEFVEGAIVVDRDGHRLEEFETDLSREMRTAFVKRLPQYVAPAEVIPTGVMPSPGSNWIIKGKFTRINQGSRFLRGSLGFGLGGTKMDASATVYDISTGEPRPFLLIETTGGSNAMPGAIMGIISWPMIASGAHGVMAGVTADGRRTAREMTGALADYLRREGVRLNGKVPHVKYKGGLALPWWSSGPPAEKKQ